MSVTVVIKGEDIKAGSNRILSNNKGKIAFKFDIKLKSLGIYSHFCKIVDFSV